MNGNSPTSAEAVKDDCLFDENDFDPVNEGLYSGSAVGPTGDIRTEEQIDLAGDAQTSQQTLKQVE